MVQAQAANVLWLPTISTGAGFNKHEGEIQQVSGPVSPVSRDSFYGGLGALMPGAASPAIPGIYANFRLADALFRPLAAQQAANARQFAAAAATNDVLLKVSLAYVELVRAHAELAIARETRNNARQLADLTADYARSGQGLQSDADRTRTELDVRENDVSRAEVAAQVASARLAQPLRLNAASWPKISHGCSLPCGTRAIRLIQSRAATHSAIFNCGPSGARSRRPMAASCSCNEALCFPGKKMY